MEASLECYKLGSLEGSVLVPDQHVQTLALPRPLLPFPVEFLS